MADTTTDRGVPYSEGTDYNNTVDEQMQGLAEFVDEDFKATLAADRGAAGQKGKRHYATDTGDWSYDTGSAWLHVGSSARAVTASGGSVVEISGTPGVPITMTLGATLGEVSVAGMYSRVLSGDGHAIRVAAGGLYRVSWQAYVVAGASHGIGQITCGYFARSFNTASGIGSVGGSGILRVAANGDITLQIIMTSGDAHAQALALQVERIAP